MRRAPLLLPLLLLLLSSLRLLLRLPHRLIASGGTSRQQWQQAAAAAAATRTALAPTAHSCRRARRPPHRPAAGPCPRVGLLPLLRLLRLCQ